MSTQNINTIIKKILIEQLTNGFIYHGTNKGAALRIQNDGYMKPKNTGEEQPSISFTNDMDYAQYYANVKGGSTNGVILRTRLSDKFKLSPRIVDNKGDEYVSFDTVPTSVLEIKTKWGKWEPLDSWDVIFDEPMLAESIITPQIFPERCTFIMEGI